MTDRLLVLVRHGQSEWNLKNLFTGWRDVDLTEKGIAEARAAGRKLKAQGICFDVAYTSGAQARAAHARRSCSRRWARRNLPVIKNMALNERDYGDLVGPQQGRRAQEMGRGAGPHLAPLLRCRAARRRKPEGHAGAHAAVLRHGNSAARAASGERVLVAAHGNSLRALMMVLERLSPEGIVKRELATGVPLIYRLNADSTVAKYARTGGVSSTPPPSVPLPSRAWRACASGPSDSR